MGTTLEKTLAASSLIFLLFALFMTCLGKSIGLYNEQTKLEIERLKYELKIYKEQEVIDAESLK